MLVDVPFAGALRFALGDMLFVREADVMRQASPKTYADELLAMPERIRLLGSADCPSGYQGDEFISTARLLKIVNENGGLEFAAKLSCYGRDISLTNDRTPTWRVCYRALEGHNVFVAEVDATSGAVTQAGIVEGRATLDCIVNVDGSLRCIVSDEDPVGAGFGAAALHIAQDFRVLQSTTGVPAPGKRVRVPLHFGFGAAPHLVGPSSE